MSQKQSSGPNPEDQDLIEPQQTVKRGQFESVDVARIFQATETLLGREENLSHGRSGDEPPTGSEQKEENLASHMNRADPDRGLSFLALLALVLGLTLSPFAIIFAYVAVKYSRRHGRRGENLAWIAVAIGWLVFSGWLVLFSSLAIVWAQL